VRKYCTFRQATDNNTVRAHCMLPTATYTHSEPVIRIVFPLQQWLHERASVLRYTYIDSLVEIDTVKTKYNITRQVLIRTHYIGNIFRLV
jgi:hypothetical protein